MKTVMVKCSASGSTKYRPLNAAARQATTIVGVCPIIVRQNPWNIMLMEIVKTKNAL